MECPLNETFGTNNVSTERGKDFELRPKVRLNHKTCNNSVNDKKLSAKQVMKTIEMFFKEILSEIHMF